MAREAELTQDKLQGLSLRSECTGESAPGVFIGGARV